MTKLQLGQYMLFDFHCQVGLETHLYLHNKGNDQFWKDNNHREV